MPKTKLPPPAPIFTDSDEEEITLQVVLQRGTSNQLRLLQRGFGLSIQQIIASGIYEVFMSHLDSAGLFHDPGFPQPVTIGQGE